MMSQKNPMNRGTEKKNETAIALTVLAALVSATLALPRLARCEEQPLKVQIVEEKVDVNNRISAGPLGLLFGVGNFTYERDLTKSITLEVSPWGIYFGTGEDALYGGGLGLGMAYYIKGNAPEGLRLALSAAPGVIGAKASDGEDSGSETAFLFGAKATIGYNWIWVKSGFTMGLNAGVQYLHFSLEDVDSALNGVLPALDFNLGFVF